MGIYHRVSVGRGAGRVPAVSDRAGAWSYAGVKMAESVHDTLVKAAEHRLRAIIERLERGTIPSSVHFDLQQVDRILDLARELKG